MKLILYSDDFLYQKLYRYYAEYDDNNEIISSQFDRNMHDIIHVNDPSYINYSINRTDGFINVTDVILQKSLFKNPILMNILFKFRHFNPDINLILYLDDDPIYYEVLLSRIAEYRLCKVVTDEKELDYWLIHAGEEQDLSEHILKKETKALLKEFRLY